MKLVIDNVLDPSEEVSNVFLITKQFKTTTDFSIHVEKQAKETQVSCMDVLVEYCIKRDLDIESVATIITSSLKEKIKVEAEQLNMLKKRGSAARLPI